MPGTSSIPAWYSLEKTKMDAAVAAGFDMMGVGGEVMVLAVLQDEPSVGLEQLLLKDQIGQGRQLLQGIRRIGIDEIETDMTGMQEPEHIAAHDTQIMNTELPAGLDDEILLGMRQLHRRHLTRTATDKLQSDTTRTGKQIEHVHPLEVHAVLEQVEQALLGEVGGRPRGDIFRGRQSPPPILSTDDPHHSQLPALLFGA